MKFNQKRIGKLRALTLLAIREMSAAMEHLDQAVVAQQAGCSDQTEINAMRDCFLEGVKLSLDCCQELNPKAENLKG